MAIDGQARTRLARAAVIDAARTLFLDRGYAATTIDAISAASGVPPATVYRLFSSKIRLLRSLLDATLAGSDAIASAREPAASPTQSHRQALFASADPRQQVAALAQIVRDINDRGAGIFAILMGAATSDPQAAELLAEYSGMREQGQGQLAGSLARMGTLRPGLREQDAADIVYALASPEMYRLLVVDRKWPSARYQQWLAAALTGQLLPEGTMT